MIDSSASEDESPSVSCHTGSTDTSSTYFVRRQRKSGTDTNKDLSIPCQGRGAAAPLTGHSSSASKDFLQISLGNSSTVTFKSGQRDQQDMLLPLLLFELLSPGHHGAWCLSNAFQTTIVGRGKKKEKGKFSVNSTQKYSLKLT